MGTNRFLKSWKEKKYPNIEKVRFIVVLKCARG